MKTLFWLLRLRMEAGLTQQQLAEKAGMNVRQYNDYENGRVTPRTAQKVRIADALGFDVSLWYENENK